MSNVQGSYINTVPARPNTIDSFEPVRLNPFRSTLDASNLQEIRTLKNVADATLKGGGIRGKAADELRVTLGNMNDAAVKYEARKKAGVPDSDERQVSAAKLADYHYEKANETLAGYGKKQPTLTDPALKQLLRKQSESMLKQ